MKVDGKGFGTVLAVMLLGMRWREVLGQGEVVSYCCSFPLFERREASLGPGLEDNKC